MKSSIKFLATVLCLSLLLFCHNTNAQRGGCNPSSGSQDPHDGNNNNDDDDDTDWDIEILVSFDPNEIIGPEGYDTVHWVAAKDNMGYTINFENDPKMATAPAKNVYLFYPVSPKHDMSTFRLGSYGFNGDVFTIPANSSFYSKRLDLQASLGIYVDVTAGIDVVNSRAFWIFESIDPLTGLSPEDPLVGLLPVKDSTITELNDTVPVAGEGFVNFIIKPKINSQTGDEALATAQIVFDANDTIPTNVEMNTLDANAPVSNITALPVNGSTVTLLFSVSDVGSGVKNYDLYVAQDTLNYNLYLSNSTDSAIQFTGITGSTYHFFSLATDHTGNREALKSLPDTSIALIQGCVTPSAPAKPSGPAFVCSGQTGVQYSISSVAGATTYQWSIPTGMTLTDDGLPPITDGISSDTTIIVSINATGNLGGFKATAVNGCGQSPYSGSFKAVRVTAAPTTPSTINNLNGTVYNFCGDTSFVLTTTSSKANSFNWNANGWTGATGTISANTYSINSLTNVATGTAVISLPPGFTYVRISVTATNCNGTSTTRYLTLRSTPSKPPLIAGNTIICPVPNDITYNVGAGAEGANSHNWTLTNLNPPASATITGTSGSNAAMATIHFEPGFISGTINAAGTNSCGNSLKISKLAVTSAPAKPGAITGPSSICKLSDPIGSYSISPVAGATGYTWSSIFAGILFDDGVQFPANPLSTTATSVNASFSFVNTGNKSIRVKSLNTCSNSENRSLTVLLSSCREGENDDKENSSSMKLEVFPNPTSGKVYILFSSETAGTCRLTIYDVTGRSVIKEEVNAIEGENMTEMNLESHSTGIYLIELKQGERVERIKIIFE